MRIFITGASGFVGKNLVQLLKRNKHTIFDEHVDVTDLPLLKETMKRFKPEGVVHLAAYGNSPSEHLDERKMFNVNALGTYNLLESCHYLAPEQIIYIGSSSEYGEQVTFMHPHMRLNPNTMYSASKGAASLFVRYYGIGNGKSTTVVRPFSIYGEHEPFTRLIPKAIKCALEGETLSIVTNPVHDWVYVGDFVNYIHELLTDGRRHDGDIYNFGTGVQTSNIQVVSMIEKIMNRTINKHIVESMRSFDSQSWRAATPSQFATTRLPDGLVRSINYVTTKTEN